MYQLSGPAPLITHVADNLKAADWAYKTIQAQGGYH